MRALLRAVAIGIGVVSSEAAAQSPRIMQIQSSGGEDDAPLYARPSFRTKTQQSLPAGAGPLAVGESMWVDGAAWVSFGLGERNVFVERRFVRPMEIERLSPTEIPIGLVCAGVEPYWDITIASASEVLWRGWADEPALLRIDRVLAPMGRTGASAALRLSTRGGMGVLTITPMHCSDTMSDRVYVWTAHLYLENNFFGGFYSVCCFLRLKR